ncbi:hypothetical protein QR680_012341 [Steinernema hermaphroditum]|nr:hypothetical protein QR680_012341 [Steinernema hermaphroditum]
MCVSPRGLAGIGADEIIFVFEHPEGAEARLPSDVLKKLDEIYLTCLDPLNSRSSSGFRMVRERMLKLFGRLRHHQSSILKMFTDFRNFNYRLTSILGSTVSLEGGVAVVEIPTWAAERLAGVVNANRNMIAWAADLHPDADSILVCEQDAEGSSFKTSIPTWLQYTCFCRSLSGSRSFAQMTIGNTNLRRCWIV